jgi:ionotropic glutamate receptor
VSGGSTEQFFRESSIPTYQIMWKYMSSNPDVFVKKNQDGIDRVKAESYAFLMESTSIEYTVQRECNLTQIGALLDNKGYGIGLPEG